jgi:hypothetical protein
MKPRPIIEKGVLCSPKRRKHFPACSGPFGPGKDLDWCTCCPLTSFYFFHGLIITFLLYSGPDRLVCYLGYGQVSVECEGSEKETVKAEKNMQHAFFKGGNNE